MKNYFPVWKRFKNKHYLELYGFEMWVTGYEALGQRYKFAPGQWHPGLIASWNYLRANNIPSFSPVSNELQYDGKKLPS